PAHLSKLTISQSEMKSVALALILGSLLSGQNRSLLSDYLAANVSAPPSALDDDGYSGTSQPQKATSGRVQSDRGREACLRSHRYDDRQGILGRGELEAWADD